MYKIFDLYNNYYFCKNFIRSKQNYINKIKKNSASLITNINLADKQDICTDCLTKAQNFVTNNHLGLLAVLGLKFATKQQINWLSNINNLAYCGLIDTNETFFENGNITDFGKFTIDKLESSDILIDISNFNEQNFMAFCLNTNKPLFCSCAATYSVLPNENNLKDYQLKIITDSGGLVGLTLDSYALSGSKISTIKDYTKHIDYCVCKFGIDHFAIGSGFYKSKHLPSGVTDYKSLQKLLIPELEKLGYKITDINKLLYQNAYNFFESKIKSTI